jgi:putative endonuclease
LKRAGYKLLARNVRAGGCEIDIVAEHSGAIVFVEVKTRRSDSFAPPELAVNRKKQMHLARAAWCFLNQNSLTDRDCRFDVVSIVNNPHARRPKIEIIPNAFQVDIWHR